MIKILHEVVQSGVMGRDNEYNLGKGEVAIGLGNGVTLHIFPDKHVETIGRSELPADAYLMLPLVVKVVPAEFTGTGDFDSILQLGNTLGEYFGSAEEIYDRVGPFLASKGIAAKRVAKALLDMSPIRIMRQSGDLSNDAYDGYKIRLENEIKRYYPGLKRKVVEARNPLRKVKTDLGKRRGKDGISF